MFLVYKNRSKKSMSLVVSNNRLQTNFSIQRPVVPIISNKCTPEGPIMYHRQDIGSSGTTISAVQLAGQCLSVIPGTSGQTYTLPTASQILQVFGRNIDSGLSRIVPGTIMEFKFVNRGSFTCAIAGNPTGSDGSAVICYTGAAGLGTGVVALSGLPTRICLEWLQVNSGTNGATGLYTIYA